MGQRALFDGDGLDGVGLDLALERGWLAVAEAEVAFDALLVEVPWEQHHLTMFGRRMPVPRLECWMGDPGARYAYSGIDLEPHAWTPTAARLRDRLTDRVGVPFDSVLINRYRDGRDSVAWHADDEPELGPEPVIASLSLGATRSFQLRRRDDPADRRAIELHHGDLLVMRGPTQAEWVHRVPRSSGAVGERLCLTFRRIAVGRP